MCSGKSTGPSGNACRDVVHANVHGNFSAPAGPRNCTPCCQLSCHHGWLPSLRRSTEHPAFPETEQAVPEVRHQVPYPVVAHHKLSIWAAILTFPPVPDLLHVWHRVTAMEVFLLGVSSAVAVHQLSSFSLPPYLPFSLSPTIRHSAVFRLGEGGSLLGGCSGARPLPMCFLNADCLMGVQSGRNRSNT